MRNLILAFIAILFSASVLSEGVVPEHSGAWYNADQPGHGLSVEVIGPDRAVAFWYAFDPQGNPMWLYIDGQIQDNTIQGLAYILDGMVWGEFDPATKNMQDWGTVDIEFNGCHEATVKWVSVFLEYGSGQLALDRLTSIFGRLCYEKSVETGFWEVTWSDLTTSETHTGTAIVDDAGLVTIDFPDNHLIGTLTRPGAANEELVMDARLDLGPMTHARELNLAGRPTVDGFQFTSETDEFEFNPMPDRPTVPVTQAYLDGQWTLQSSNTNLEMVNGEFSWDILAINVWIQRTIQMTIPSYGGNTIPIVVTDLYEPHSGHAFYWRDVAAGMEYIEIRWVWDDVILATDTMERPIP